MLRQLQTDAQKAGKTDELTHSTIDRQTNGQTTQQMVDIQSVRLGRETCAEIAE